MYCLFLEGCLSVIVIWTINLLFKKTFFTLFCLVTLLKKNNIQHVGICRTQRSPFTSINSTQHNITHAFAAGSSKYICHHPACVLLNLKVVAAIHELNYIPPCGLRLPQSTSRNPRAEPHSTSWIAAAAIHNDVPQLEPYCTAPFIKKDLPLNTFFKHRAFFPNFLWNCSSRGVP